MEDIFGIKSDIGSVIAMAEKFLNNLNELRKKQGSAVTLNPNYVHLLNKVFNSPDVMFYKRRGGL